MLLCSIQFTSALEQRLSDEQKQVICFNRATLLLHSNKVRVWPLLLHLPWADALCIRNEA